MKSYFQFVCLNLQSGSSIYTSSYYPGTVQLLCWSSELGIRHLHTLATWTSYLVDTLDAIELLAPYTSSRSSYLLGARWGSVPPSLHVEGASSRKGAQKFGTPQLQC